MKKVILITSIEKLIVKFEKEHNLRVALLDIRDIDNILYQSAVNNIPIIVSIKPSDYITEDFTFIISLITRLENSNILFFTNPCEYNDIILPFKQYQTFRNIISLLSPTNRLFLNDVDLVLKELNEGS